VVAGRDRGRVVEARDRFAESGHTIIPDPALTTNLVSSEQPLS
jgi:hypothetical protein